MQSQFARHILWNAHKLRIALTLLSAFVISGMVAKKTWKERDITKWQQHGEAQERVVGYIGWSLLPGSNWNEIWGYNLIEFLTGMVDMANTCIGLNWAPQLSFQTVMRPRNTLRTYSSRYSSEIRLYIDTLTRPKRNYFVYGLRKSSVCIQLTSNRNNWEGMLPRYPSFLG